MANKEREKKKRKLASAKKGNDAMSGFRPPYLNIPSGVEMFKFEKDRDYNLDLVPYEVGKGNPWADEGELYFCRPVYIYKDIGADEKSRCSPKTFGKPDPVAKEIVKMVRKGTIKDGSDEHKAMMDKTRVLYWVYDRDEPEKGVRLFDSAYFKSFGVLLKNAMDKDPDDDKGYQTFHDPDGGYSLMVTVAPDNFKGKDFVKPVKISFVKRPEGIPEEILEQAKCLDDMPIEIDGDELLKIFLGEAEPEAPKNEEEDDDAPPPPKAKEKAKPPEEKPPAPTKPQDGQGDETAEDLGIVKGAKVTHAKLGECTVVKISPDGTSLTLKDSDGDVHTAIAPAKVKLAKEETKKPAGKKPAPPPPPDEDEEEDETSDSGDEDDPDDESGDDDWEDD